VSHLPCSLLRNFPVQAGQGRGRGRAGTSAVFAILALNLVLYRKEYYFYHNCTAMCTAILYGYYIRRIRHYRPEHVSRCLGSAALRGGTDDGSILRLIRGD
jgi:hypothetical protein